MTAHGATVDHIAARLTGTPLLLLLDIDGTLCELMPHADAARVPAETCATLERLAARDGVAVALVTGRSVRDAARIAPVRGARIVGNHGLEWGTGEGASTPHPAWCESAGALREAAARIPASLADTPGAWLEDKGFSLTVHLRQAPAALAPHASERVAAIAAELGLRVTSGKAVLNVLPAAAVDKGTAVAQLLHELGGDTPGAAILFAGDDVTDEDAFRTLRARAPGAVTVHVGDPAAPTAAEYRLPDTAAVAALLAAVERTRA